MAYNVNVTSPGINLTLEYNATIVEGAQGPKGDIGPQGIQGPQGETGLTGPGVASGGTTGQILVKLSDNDYDTGWIDSPNDRVIISEEAPQVARSGDEWFNPTNQILSVYTDLGWVQISADDLQF